MAETIPVLINYIDGTSKTVSASIDRGVFEYNHEKEMLYVYIGIYRMMIPREFVKSIRVIEAE